MNESDDESVLRDNLRMQALSPEALARIRRATEAEWRAQVGPARRRWMPVATAAATLIAAVATWTLWSGGQQDIPGAPLARVERIDAPGAVELGSWWGESALNVGAELHGGQRTRPAWQPPCSAWKAAATCAWRVIRKCR
jgi:hypothetical protein